MLWPELLTIAGLLAALRSNNCRWLGIPSEVKSLDSLGFRVRGGQIAGQMRLFDSVYERKHLRGEPGEGWCGLEVNAKWSTTLAAHRTKTPEHWHEQRETNKVQARTTTTATVRWRVRQPGIRTSAPVTAAVAAARKPKQKLCVSSAFSTTPHHRHHPHGP